MDLTFSESELAFRDELRAWFSANPPVDEPVGDEDAHYHWRADFQRRLADHGRASSTGSSTTWPTTAGPPFSGRSSTAGAARP